MSEGILHHLSLLELGQGLRAGTFSSAELTAYFLERLERLGPRYNAVAHVCRPSAEAAARQADEALQSGEDKGPLHGIPYGVKDLLATRGIPTSWGFGPFKDRIIDKNAAVIDHLEAAGAVLCAKLAMVELAGGMRYNQPDASFTGPGINPWNESAWTGGSSSGSGAAIAAGLVPLALGTETMGSITTPAAFCGISGLRPGIARVSNHGSMALSWTMDKIGPMARSAEDCGIALEAIARPHPADPLLDPRPFRLRSEGPPPKGWRLCVIRGSAESDQPGVTANFQEALRQLEAVGSIEEHELPEFPYLEIAQTIAFSEAGAAFTELRANPALAVALAAPESRGSPFALPAISAISYINALRLRQQMHGVLADWFASFDAIVSPTLKVVAPPLGTQLSEYYAGNRRLEVTMAACLLGWPALTVPNGFGERGLPTGLQFLAPPDGENTVLNLAQWYQQQTDWHRPHPNP